MFSIHVGQSAKCTCEKVRRCRSNEAENTSERIVVLMYRQSMRPDTENLMWQVGHWRELHSAVVEILAVNIGNRNSIDLHSLDRLLRACVEASDKVRVSWQRTIEHHKWRVIDARYMHNRVYHFATFSVVIHAPDCNIAIGAVRIFIEIVVR